MKRRVVADLAMIETTYLAEGRRRMTATELADCAELVYGGAALE